VIKLKRVIKAFTITELLLVSAVAAILLAVSIPSFVTAYIRSSETDAITSLGKLSAALEVYRTLYKTYPSNLSSLSIVNPTLSVGPLLTSGSKAKYNFQFDQSSAVTRNTFSVTAQPKQGSIYGLHTFKVDQMGSLYRSDTVYTGEDTVPSIVFSPYNPNNPHNPSTPTTTTQTATTGPN